ACCGSYPPPPWRGTHTGRHLHLKYFRLPYQSLTHHNLQPTEIHLLRFPQSSIYYQYGYVIAHLSFFNKTC
ncbi:hypothetical protein, partial [Schleiferia thermophila]